MIRYALTVAAAAAAFVAVPVSAATITFDALPGANQDPFTSYTEAGYTITKTSGDAFVGKAYGNPLPSVFFGPFYGSATATFSLTSASGAFTFNRFDYSPNGGSAMYIVAGFLGASSVYAYTGILPGPGFTTVTGNAGVVDQVVLTLVSMGTSANIDNLVVNAAAVPEAATWAMMIAGFGLAGWAMRRRQRVSVRFA